MSEISRQKVALSFCVLLGGLLSSGVHAGSEDFFDLPPEHLSKLKITAASAFAESALDSSATVSVVTRSDWERRGARNLPDAVMHLPGVMLLVPPDGGMVIQVRSYDSTSLRGRATLVDGVPINTFAFGSEVFSNAEMQLPVMDSLELVRGPSSILYGSDAFHSALLLSTYHSTIPGFEVSGESGSRNYQQVALRGTEAFGNDQSLQVALAASHQGDQGSEYLYRAADGTQHTTTREQGYHSGTGMVRWEGRASGVGYHLELFTDQTSANEFPGAGTIFGDVRDRDIADRNSHLWMLKGQLVGDLGAGWDWRWDNYYWRNDYGQSYFLLLPFGYSNEDQQILEHRYGSRLHVKRADIDLLGAVTQLALSAGTERAAVDDHHVTSLVNANPPSYKGLAQTINSMSLEGKTQWQKGRYQLIYGGRVDDYSTFGSQVSPRFGAIWIPAEDYSIKALYGKAFRAPNANELRGTNFAAGDLDLKPETLDSYELAFALSRNGWQTELVGFENRWHDRILLSSTGGLHYVNFGESKSQGVEASVNYVAERWRMELSGSRITNRNLRSHEESSIFPKWIINAGLGYRWPAQRLELFVSNRIHEDVKSGDQALSALPLPDAGLFFRTDVSLRQQWSAHWQGQLTLRNVFGRDNVWPSIVNSRGGVEDIPRQISLEIEYRSLP
jgi:iron complex outermembrane receptor protein